MNNIIFHIDVNNAFLSWSAVDLLNKNYKIDIREEYAVIGGDESKRHGVVLAKSPLAKQKGIITGESLYSARKKFPNLKIYPPQYNLYQKMSNELFELLSNYTPDIEVYSIDECFIDYGKIKKLYGNEIEFANKLKEEIKLKLGFTVNIGIGNNKLCAKMASDFSKPDQVHTLYNYEIKAKMWPLPVQELFGIGKKTTSKLNAINIHTISDLATANITLLVNHFKNQVSKMVESANGIDDSIVKVVKEPQKGISKSVTLEKDIKDKEEANKIIFQLADELGVILRSKKKYASVVAVNLKDMYFNNYSHQLKLKNPTNVTKEIYDTSKRLFAEMWNLKPIRLIGIRLDGLTNDNSYQLSIFEKEKENQNQKKIDEVVDILRQKYGSAIIQKATLSKFKNNK